MVHSSTFARIISSVKHFVSFIQNRDLISFVLHRSTLFGFWIILFVSEVQIFFHYQYNPSNWNLYAIIFEDHFLYILSLYWNFCLYYKIINKSLQCWLINGRYGKFRLNCIVVATAFSSLLQGVKQTFIHKILQAYFFNRIIWLS